MQLYGLEFGNIIGSLRLTLYYNLYDNNNNNNNNNNNYYFKGELKAEISNNYLSNISFGKPNISKLKSVELFPLVSCFFTRKLCLKLGFSSFCGLKN